MTAPNKSDPAHLLAEQIHGIRMAMMTTAGADGHLRCRPMATQGKPTSDGLWFFATRHSPLVENLKRRSEANAAYVDVDSDRYVSVAGQAMLRQDPNRVADLWSPAVAAWFPKGKDDPELILIQFEIEDAEYWDRTAHSFLSIPGFPLRLAARQG